MELKAKLILFLATGFCSGKIPAAPGTFGSLMGLLVCYPLSFLSRLEAMPVLAGLAGLSILVAGRAEALLNQKDPGCIVIDEINGMAFALAGLPFSWPNVLAGFILFRILDILKPFPIGNLQKRFSGGLGIVIDDLVAGIITNLILNIMGTILRCMGG